MNEVLYLLFTSWCAATSTHNAVTNAARPTKNATPETTTSPGALSGIPTPAATRRIHRAMGTRWDRQYAHPPAQTASAESAHAAIGAGTPSSSVPSFVMNELTSNAARMRADAHGASAPVATMTQKLAVNPALRSAWLTPPGAPSVGHDGPPKNGPHPGGYRAKVRSASGVGAGVAWGCAACSDGTNFTAAISSLVLAPSAGDTSGVSSQPWGFGLRSRGCRTASLSYSGGLTGGSGTGASGSIPESIAARLRASSSALTSLSMPTSPMSRLPSPKSLS
mmetsp:Transcript_1503/g.6596  ORF Transcript_1503/g.6596 Transcript_1503/m.6596 type:complete len:279 (+) Transcript_1503:1849-2685(+)